MDVTFWENFANFWRARYQLYQNEILQENMPILPQQFSFRCNGKSDPAPQFSACESFCISWRRNLRMDFKKNIPRAAACAAHGGRHVHGQLRSRARRPGLAGAASARRSVHDLDCDAGRAATRCLVRVRSRMNKNERFIEFPFKPQKARSRLYRRLRKREMANFSDSIFSRSTRFLDSCQHFSTRVVWKCSK